VNHYHLNRGAILYGAYFPIRELDKYGFAGKPSKYKVNSFQEIGWPDPFPHAQATYTHRFKAPRALLID